MSGPSPPEACRLPSGTTLSPGHTHIHRLLTWGVADPQHVPQGGLWLAEQGRGVRGTDCSAGGAEGLHLGQPLPRSLWLVLGPPKVSPLSPSPTYLNLQGMWGVDVGPLEAWQQVSLWKRPECLWGREMGSNSTTEPNPCRLRMAVKGQPFYRCSRQVALSFTHGSEHPISRSMQEEAA